MSEPTENRAAFRVQQRELQAILSRLADAGYELIGPTLRGGAIVYDPIDSVDDLPVGWTDEQEAGTYSVGARRDGAFFGYGVGPESWKRFLHPPRVRLWSAHRKGDGFDTVADESPAPKYAFIGVRPCEISAIEIQDAVLIDGSIEDPIYKARREQAFILAVQCTQVGGTCFCASMHTGPKAESGFDLALTELLDATGHAFLLEVGSDRGAATVQGLDLLPATNADRELADELLENSAQRMGRQMDITDLQELLQNNRNHPRWIEVGKRCLTCCNCTMVCPTCFCTTVEDVTDLSGDHAERHRRWESCFTLDFSYVHGGSARLSAASRYRQWMTHKLSTWYEQFGTSGCVGCGRCITWCPSAIDITEEVAAIQATTEKGAP